MLMTATYATDWLGTEPYFYNERTGAVARSIHDVIDYRNLEIDPDGLIDYLDFGYCVFGHTPVQHVRFVAPCAQLTRNDAGELTETPLPDPVDSWSSRSTTPAEAVECLRAELQAWEDSHPGNLVLPLSGGHDSRLLAVLTRDKSRIRSFTYGTSKRQSQSREVTRAQYVAEVLGLSWEQIELCDFHDRMGDWDDLFGVSTHAHGMYHLEFYDKIARRIGSGGSLLSGLCGDAWAGHIPRLPAESAADLPVLGLTRGVRAGGNGIRLQGDGRYREDFWSRRSERFRDPIYQIVEVIRLKMILLRFALLAPANRGFTPTAPYLRPEVALTMIRLPAQQRHQRRWQHDFFRKCKLDLTGSFRGSRENNLDLHVLRQFPPAPLDLGLLRELFATDYLERINREVFSPAGWQRLLSLSQGHAVGARLGSLARLPSPHSAAYNAYLTLKPLENLLRRRNLA
jgi:hypothetical protein